jgi:carbonic anhydrase
MHFHAPSEHTINGVNFDLELHLVHKDVITNKPAAVIAILFKVNDTLGTNKFLDQIVPDLYIIDSLTNTHIGEVKLASFLS